MMAKAAGDQAGVVRGMRMMAKVAGALQRRAFRAVLEDGGGGLMIKQSVTVRVLLRPTLTDTLARVKVGGCRVEAVSQIVTEVRARMEEDGKRARRAVLALLRWWVQHDSVGGEAQPSVVV